MRVGIFTESYNPYISGVITSINMLEQGLKDLGHEVFIFTFNLVSKIEYEKDNVVYFSGFKIPIKTLDNYKLSPAHDKKVRIIEKYELDVIHIHTEFSMGKLGAISAKKLNIPAVYTFHTLYEDYLRYFSKFLDKYCHQILMRTLRKVIRPINNSSMIKIVPTSKVLKHTNKYGVDGDIRVIPSGIELEMFYKDVSFDEIALLKKQYDINIDEFVFATIGRVSEEKSLDKVVRGFAMFSKTNKGKLLIVGNGPFLDGLKKLVKKLEIEDLVIFVGFISWNDITKYYQVANIIVNASITETQGLTNIESLASGRPLLVQKDECLNDVIVENSNGIYFDGIDDLCAKMIYCVEHKDNLKKMQINCRKSVEKFSKLCYANSVLKLYEEAIEKNKVL